MRSKSNLDYIIENTIIGENLKEDSDNLTSILNDMDSELAYTEEDFE